MEIRELSIEVSQSIGKVSVILRLPTKAKAIVTLAHGAGAGMRHSFMELLAIKLQEHSIGTLRFNFPFTENNKKRPDVPVIAEKTVSAVLNFCRESLPSTPVFAAGKSFGGRMTSNFCSKNSVSFVRGIIFYGFPLHPAGEPAITRAEHLYSVAVPMLFLQGSRDALAELSLIESVCQKLPQGKLIIFDGADHSFKSGKRDFIPELSEATDGWITTILK